MSGKDLRLSKFFSKGKNAVVVAADHGEFDGPIPGLIDLPEVLKAVDPMVDAVLLSPGMLPHCRHVFNFKGAPMPMVRLNWGTVYCFHWDYGQAATEPALRPRQAVQLGAELVLISLTLRSGNEERDARNVKVFCDLAAEAKDLGLPVVGEVFPAAPNKMSKEELHEYVYTCCRIISELGADLIKTYNTCRFAEVTASCPVPILGLGAEKTPTDLEALELARSEIEAGARGVVFGRNVLQAKDPKKFAAALCRVVKQGADPREMVEKYGLE